MNRKKLFLAVMLAVSFYPVFPKAQANKGILLPDYVTTQDKARRIMGKNYFGAEEAVKYFGIRPKTKELAALLEVPFSEWTLEERRESHILVAVFPMSISKIRYKMGPKFFQKSDTEWAEQAFANNRGEVGWHLVRKKPVKRSAHQSWEGQQEFLDGDETVPSARVLVYATVGHYLATGERLFKRVFVRTSDFNYLFGGHVAIGYFAVGMGVRYYPTYYRRDYLAVAAESLPEGEEILVSPNYLPQH